MRDYIMSPLVARQREGELLSPLVGYASRAAYTKAARRVLKAWGYQVAQARHDNAGDCLTCGECGRCPGVHIVGRL